MNGGTSRWAVDFLPADFKYSSYIQPCGQPCGRSGYCTERGAPNEQCGCPKHYVFSMCQE